MNAAVELNLALVLFLPWYAILGALYWLYPRQPRSRRRRGFDVASLAFATAATVASMHWSYLGADTRYGGMWPQVLATAVSYAVFLGAMTAAFIARHRFVVVPARAGASPTRTSE